MNSPNNRPPPPLIRVPSSLREDYLQRLEGTQNARLAFHQDHDFIDVGDNTLVLLHEAKALMPGVSDGSLVLQLKDMAQRCEYPVLLVVGSLYGKPPLDVRRSRSAGGFVAYLELFTRVRAIQVPDRAHTAMMLQLLAKQSQTGFHSLGLEDL